MIKGVSSQNVKGCCSFAHQYMPNTKPLSHDAQQALLFRDLDSDYATVGIKGVSTKYKKNDDGTYTKYSLSSKMGSEVEATIISKDEFDEENKHCKRLMHNLKLLNLQLPVSIKN